MDDALKTVFSSILIVLALATGGSFGHKASAVELEYIPAEKAKDLADRFASAVGPTSNPANLAKILGQNQRWSCSMYGMRSRLQVERGVFLYSFSVPRASSDTHKTSNSDLGKASDQAWNNNGAQPIHEYHFVKNSLIGKSGKLEDEVRLTAKGQLISRVSSSADGAAPGSALAESEKSATVVIAYSICDAVE